MAPTSDAERSPRSIRLTLDVPVDPLWLQLEAALRGITPDAVVRTLADVLRLRLRARVCRREGVLRSGVHCDVSTTGGV